MSLARLANIAHSASESEVRRLLEQVPVSGEGQDLCGWSFHGVRALYRLIEVNEDPGALNALLERPELDVNCRNKDGLAPLHVAALQNRIVAVRLLMERQDLDLNPAADFELTPLHLAARLGHTQVLKALLDDASSRLFWPARTLHAFSALHLVVEGAEDFSDLLLNCRRASVEQRALVVGLLRTEQEKRGLHGLEDLRDVVGRTALHYAAIAGHVELVRELLQFSDLNPNIVDSYGLTPLHLAVQHGHVSVACLIMQVHLVDLNCPSVLRSARLQVAPLQSSCSTHTSCYMMHLLYPVWSDDGDKSSEIVVTGITPAHIAAGGSHFDIFSALLNSRCCNVRAVDSRGCSVLHYAAVSGDVRAVNLLLNEPDVDVNCRDIDGVSPLELSVVHARLDVMKMFLGDCTLHMPEDLLHHSTKLLAIATRQDSVVGDGHSAVAHYLLDSLEESVRMAEGSSGSNWACQNDNVELIELILAWRPDAANATNRERRTPLHLAVIHGHTEVVLGLCQDRRLRAAEVDKLGGTPIDYAFEQGKPSRPMQKILLRREDVKEYNERIYRLDMNTMNALFIGATLFASVTYIAWMQPPGGLVQNYKFPVPSPPAAEGTFLEFANTANLNVKLFFIFNTIAFIFSLVTIFHGIEALTSNRRQLDIRYVSRYLRSSIRHCNWYLVLASIFIIAAFEQAGYAALAPGELWYVPYIMHVLWATGGMVSIIYGRKFIRRKCKRCWRRTRSKIQRAWSKKPAR